MSDSDLIFREPPYTASTGGRWKNLAKRLQAHPGEWVFVGTFDAATAGNGRNRLQAQGCEATCRSNFDAQVPGGKPQADLYARYTNGEAS